MTGHDWFVEHRNAFVARILDPDEEKAFVDHLAHCQECAQEIARADRELRWLSMGTQPAPARPGLSRKLSDGLIRHGRWRWNHLTTVAGVAALIMAAIGYAIGRRTDTGPTRAADSLQVRLAVSEMGRVALLDTLSVLRGASRILQANFQLDDQPGGLFLFADERTHRWNVVVHGLPPAGPDRLYQFWFICEDGMVRGAVVHADTTGPAFMTMEMPPKGGNVLGAALTVEPMDSVTSIPRGKELVHLIL
jgi:hypothetical protein